MIIIKKLLRYSACFSEKIILQVGGIAINRDSVRLTYNLDIFIIFSTRL